MKELTIEEKAKCYDEAIERAKKIHKYSSDLAEIKRIEQIFPELKESEDERISKEIIDIIDSYDVAHLRAAGLPSRIPKYIAWLEKQGERMSDPRYSILDKLIEADGIYQMAMNDAMVQEAKTKAIDALSKLEIGKLLEIEKQGEQKPAEEYNITGIKSRNAQGKLGEMIKNLKPELQMEDKRIFCRLKNEYKEI